MSRRSWKELRAERLAAPEAGQAYLTASQAFRIAEEIRRLRIEHGLSQRELAERMGATQPVIARLEAGGVEPHLSTLDRVARALGVELEVRFSTNPPAERSVS